MRSRVALHAILILALGVPLATAQRKSPVNGTWEIKAGSITFQMTFAEDQGDVTGTAKLPGGETVEIEYGFLLGKELEFTTVENGVEYEWTAEVGRNSIKGERLNLDDETTVRFTAKRVR